MLTKSEILLLRILAPFSIPKSIDAFALLAVEDERNLPFGGNALSDMGSGLVGGEYLCPSVGVRVFVTFNDISE